MPISFSIGGIILSVEEGGGRGMSRTRRKKAARVRRESDFTFRPARVRERSQHLLVPLSSKTPEISSSPIGGPLLLSANICVAFHRGKMEICGDSRKDLARFAMRFLPCSMLASRSERSLFEVIRF